MCRWNRLECNFWSDQDYSFETFVLNRGAELIHNTHALNTCGVEQRITEIVRVIFFPLGYVWCVVVTCSHCMLVILSRTHSTPWYSSFFGLVMAISGTFYISIRKKANLKEHEIESLKFWIRMIWSDYSGAKKLRHHEKHPHLTR